MKHLGGGLAPTWLAWWASEVFWGIQILQKNCEINLLIKMFLGLVELMSQLVNVSISLPQWQAVKMTFFAPWALDTYVVSYQNITTQRILLEKQVDWLTCQEQEKIEEVAKAHSWFYACISSLL